MSDTTTTPASARTELDDRGVLTVTLTRPARRNALDWEIFETLHEAYAVRSRETAVRCVVLRGEGPSFCAGLDRGILQGLGGGGESGVRDGGGRLQAILDAMEAAPVPTLAVIQGACVGGGLALALAVDLRIASDDAFFSMMEMRYAFVPDLGHVHRLQREVGLARAKQMIFFGERIDATTLGSWGVLNEVVPVEELGAAAQRWVARCAGAPPLAVRAVKAIMQADPGGQDGPASQRAALDANATGLLMSNDFTEGLTAQLEGRDPRFAGD